MKTIQNPVNPEASVIVSKNVSFFELLHNRALSILPNRKPYAKSKSAPTEYDNMNHYSSERYDNGLSFYSDEFVYEFCMFFGGFYYRCTQYRSTDIEIQMSKKPLF